MRYYHQEHYDTYKRLGEQNLNQWNDLFGSGSEWTYDHFQNRDFLDRAIAALDLPDPKVTSVLEYGCGTGPAACYLASQGFDVVAFDLVPEAIEIACRMSARMGMQVDFRVGDVCALPDDWHIGQFDIVLDSFCLQSIVTDEDRANLFSFVSRSLKSDGYYLISTALYSPERVYEPEYLYDPESGIAYVELMPGSAHDDVVEIDGRAYLPHRRHLTPDALRRELEQVGFEVLSLDGSDVVCRLSR